MYKKLHLKIMILLCALVAGGSAWAETTYKLTIDDSDFNTTSYAANNNEKTSYAVCTTDATKTYEVKWTSNQVMKNGDNMQWQKSKGYIYNSTDLGTITSVTVTSSAGSFTTYYGTSEQPSSSTTVGGGFFKTAVGSATGTSLKVEVTFTISEGTPKTQTSVSIDHSGITNTDVYAGTAAGSLSATVSANVSAISGASVTWSSSDTGVATIASDGKVTLVAAGTTTITASYAGDDTYAASSATYELTVTDSTPYVQPTVIEITPNYTFWGKTGQFSGNTYSELSGSQDNVALDWNRGTGSTYANTTAMRFYKDNTLTFTAPEGYQIISIELAVSGTYDDLSFSPNRFDSETKTWTGTASSVTMSRPSNASSYATISKFTITLSEPSSDASITVGNNTVNVTAEEAEGTITVTYNNISEVEAEVFFCNENGEEATYNWIDAEINQGNNIYYTISANEGEARTAYMKVYALDDNAEDVYSELITINQAAPVVDYAILPFSYDGNGAMAEEENGVTTHGLSSYNNSPAIKFDDNGDYLILKTNAAPATISFVVKGNGSGSLSQAGTFMVQTSADGENYSDLAVYETFSSDATEISLYNQDENVRYVKWIYYEKVTGNVALGEINVTAELPTFTAEVTSAKWASYVAPISVSFPTGVQAYIVNDANSTKVSLTEVLAVPAGTPVVLNAEQGTYTLSVEAAADCDDVSANQLVVSDGTVEGDGESIYALGNKGGSVGFKRVKNGVTVPAGKPYLTIANGAKDFFGFDEGEATGIESIENAGFSFSAPIYDLQGRQVNKLQKGIFIQSGKKVVVK